MDDREIWSTGGTFAMAATKNEVRREIVALCLIATCLFAGVALLSYREVGTGSDSGLANLCGRVGYSFAHFSLQNFGFASWLLVLCVGFWGIALFIGKQLAVNTARIVGLWSLMLVSAALLSHFWRGRSESLPDPGGFLGLFVNSLLMERVSLGVGGTRILLGLMFLITSILATDWLLLSSIRRMFTALRSLRESRKRRVAERGDAEAYDEEYEDEFDAEEASDDGDESIAEGPRKPFKMPYLVRKVATSWSALARFFSGGPQGTAIADDLEIKHTALVPRNSAPGKTSDESKAPGPENTDSEASWSDDDGESEGDEDEEWEDDGEGEWEYEDEGEWEYEDEGEEWEEGDDEVEVEVVAKPSKKSSKKKDKKGSDKGIKKKESKANALSKAESKDIPPGKSLPVFSPTTLDLTPPEDPLEALDEPVNVSAPKTSRGQPYQFPPLDLLNDPEPVSSKEIDRHIAQCAKILEETLVSFRIEGRIAATCRGPVITMYEIALKPGTKVDRLRSIEDELAMALKARSVRIVAPLIGKSTVGIEVPNVVRETVSFKELVVAARIPQRKMAIPIMLGKDAAGKPLIDDLAQMPHMLVAGSTGSGKSVCLNTIIMSILYTRTPEQCKLILIDPKMVELSLFQNVAHLMCPVVTDMRRAATILDWAVEKMEARYELLSRAGVRNIYSFNNLSLDELEERLGEPVTGDSHPMAFIVIVVDELADLMMASGKEVEAQITRLAQKSRAVGIHVVLATQRPSTNVITGLIKANMPTRISFMVTSKVDSRVILDANGAEKLLGAGDMLYMPPRTSRTTRAQSSYIEDSEIRDVVKFIRETSSPEYSKELIQARKSSDQNPAEVDDLWEEAVAYVLETSRGSASLLQRRFKIGYTRASRLIDMMASAGILGEYKGSQAREVLVTLEEWQATKTEQAAPLEG